MKKIKIIFIILISIFLNITNVYAQKSLNDGTYIISSLLNQNQNIDVSGANTSNGTNIQIWQNNGNNAQKWIIEYLNSGYYIFRSKLNTNKCLEVKESKYINNSNIELNDCNKNDNQQFSIKNLGNDYFSIITKNNNNMYLDVDGAKTTNGTNIQLWQNNGNNAQKWRFTEVLDLKQTIYEGTYTISSELDNNKNIDVDGAKTTNGTNIQLWQSNGNNAQKWIIKYLNNGYYIFKSKLNTNKCLEIKNNNFSIYSNIQLSDCTNKDNQQFIIKKLTNDNYSIISKINHIYIDVDGAKTKNGTNIQLFYNNDNNAQKWKFNLVTETNKKLEDGTYTIHSMLNENKTIDIESGNTNNETNIQLYESNNTDAQKWIIEYLNNGYYKFKSKKDSTKCLDIKNNEYYNNTNIQLYECNNSESQQFALKDLNNNFFVISAKYNNENIDISEAKTANGTNIQLWKDNNNSAQKWKFIEDISNEQTIDNSNYIIQSALDENKNLDVSGAKTANGTNIQIWQNNGNKAQKWKIEYENGYYRFKSRLNQNKCLEVKNNLFTIYSNIQLSDCTNKDNQLFIIKNLNNNYYSIITKINHLYLDVDGAKTSNGTNVQLYFNNGNNAQKWKIIDLNENNIEDGTYIITPTLNNNLTVDVSEAKSFNNTNIQLYEKNGNNAQKWYIQKQKDKTYLIRSTLYSNLFLSYKDNNILLSETKTKWEIEKKQNNKYILKVKDKELYLTIETQVPKNNTNLILSTSDNNQTNIFEFSETEITENSNTISTSYYTIETKLKDKQNIDVSTASKLNGTNIQLWENNDNKAQIWYIKYLNNGIYQILSSMNTSLTLNIANDNTTPGSNIELWNNTKKDTQKWKLIDDKNGYISIKNLNTNLCISVENNTGANNSNIELQTCNNKDNQKFKLNRYTKTKTYKGIDVSQYQGNIDWQKVSKNIDFVIIRAGYGDNWSSQDDKKVIKNIEECQKYNIPYGLYLYSYAKRVQKDSNDANLNYDAESAVSEAAHMMRIINSVNYKPNLKTSVYLDMEEESIGKTIDKTTLTNITNKFCSIIENNSYGCGVYANRNWLKNHLDINNIIKNYDLWLAEWIDTTDYNQAIKTTTDYQTTKKTLWQFSAYGTTPGITGDVDLDIGYDIFD